MTVGAPREEVFTGEVIRVSGARPAVESSRSAAHRRAAARYGRSASGSPLNVLQAPPGLVWGAEDDPNKGVVQALIPTFPVVLVSILVVLVTGWGLGENDVANPGPWYWVRRGLLIMAAVAGTMALRREPVTRLGLFPDPMGILVAALVGLVVGFAGSRVAPIRIEGGSFAVAAGAIVFEAVAHEVFFRGYVTRVLLIHIPKVATALIASCLIYGTYFLSYYNVLQQTGFYMLYYSILLFGFGLGGIYAVLYWRSRSIWPSIVAHSLVLLFSALLAP
jgi:membrane protease YdiL (CAAX protease family)